MSALAKVRETLDVPARTGCGFEVTVGDKIRVTDLEGSQPVDFWAFNKENHLEFLSCEHTKPTIEKLFPHLGDSAYTNQRRKIVTVVEDTSPGQHDMQYAACDATRYAQLGVEGYPVPLQHLLLYFRQAYSLNSRRRPSKVLVDQVLAQTHRLEDLGATVALNGGYAHFGHDLQDALFDGLDKVLLGVFRLGAI